MARETLEGGPSRGQRFEHQCKKGAQLSAITILEMDKLDMDTGDGQTELEESATSVLKKIDAPLSNIKW